jgi:hypothetical protein
MSKDNPQDYRGNGEHGWEDVTRGFDIHNTVRLRVPGGWLYKVTHLGSFFTTTFVPMPEVVKHKV